MAEIEKVFADGLIFKNPRDGAPDFVKGSVSVKVAEFTEFIKKHDNNGWVNLDVKESKGGKMYMELNTWKPEGESEAPKEGENDQSIPF